MPATPRLYPDYFNARPEKQVRGRARRTVEIPERASPHVKLYFNELRRQRVRYDDVEECAAVRRAKQKAWKRKNFLLLSSLQAAFSYLGWDYVPVPALEVLPPEVAGEITALALKMQRGRAN